MDLSTMPLNANTSATLLEAFRVYYHRYSAAVTEAVLSSADTNVLARLGDGLDEYLSLVTQVGNAAWLKYSTLALIRPTLVCVHFSSRRASDSPTQHLHDAARYLYSVWYCH